MVLPLSLSTGGTVTAVAKAAATRAAFDLGPAVFGLRGGAQEFNMGLVKTRLDGLGYPTVTTLMIGAGLGLFGATPRTLEPIPDDPEKAKGVKLNNALKIVFGLCMSLSVALALYTTTVFALMSIYSKTALGMGLEGDYLEFFDALAKFRQSGFRSFVGTLNTFNLCWMLSLILRYDAPLRWYIPIPAILVGIVGMKHYNFIMKLAGDMIYGAK